MHLRRKTLTVGAFCAAAVATVALSGPASAGKTTPFDPTTLTYPAAVVATNPSAAAMPTARAREIHDLAGHNGKIWMGYGDYGANTGPVDLRSYDPATGQVSDTALTVPTEEVRVLRKINGSLYAPMVDPTLAWTANVGYATNASGVWENKFNAPMVHNFDVATLTGTDLWMAGSMEGTGAQNAATAYRSTDGGQTWNVVAQDTSAGTASGFERYYFAAPLKGKMYLQAQYIDGNYDSPGPVRVFDGSTWSTMTPAGYKNVCATYDSNQALVYKDKLVCQNAIGLTAFDGTTVVPASPSYYATDLTVGDDGYLYLLSGNTVLRSSDGVNFTRVATFTSAASPTSIEVMNKKIYVGLADSTLVRLDQSCVTTGTGKNAVTTCYDPYGTPAALTTQTTSTQTAAPTSSTTTSTSNGKGKNGK